MFKLGGKEEIILSAVTDLTKMYMGEPVFQSEFDQICQRYEPVTKVFVVSWLDSYRRAVRLSDSEYDALTAKLVQRIEKVEVDSLSPDLFVTALDELAWKWKLKLPKPLAGFNLFIFSTAQVVKSLGIVLMEGPFLQPGYRLPPLNLLIPESYFLKNGIDGVLKDVRSVLSEYAKELRSKGVSNFPPSLRMHAEWWFAYYVKKEGKYSDLADQYGVEAETIKQKVYEFRRLLHIVL